jgi:hypothetical protein
LRRELERFHVVAREHRRSGLGARSVTDLPVESEHLEVALPRRLRVQVLERLEELAPLDELGRRDVPLRVRRADVLDDAARGERVGEHATEGRVLSVARRDGRRHRRRGKDQCREDADGKNQAPHNSSLLGVRCQRAGE